MLARFGFRAVITLGALAYFVRYFIWSTDLPVPVLVSSQVLHGVCYAGFFAGAYIYTDRIAPDDIRHSAQTVFGILILGGGPVLGGILSGWMQARHTLADGSVDYAALWRIVSMIGLATAIFFWSAFRERKGVTA
jgi:MFS family permease